MGNERGETSKLTSEAKEAEEQAKKYRGRAAVISKAIKLKGKFSFDDKQMRLFNSRFAHALCVKEAADNDRRTHSGLYIVAERFGISSYRDMINRQSDINKLTAQILINSFETTKSGFDRQKGSLSPNSIANTANFLSSLYLECNENKTNFETAVEERLDYLRRLYLRVDSR